jgi:hypothetical protein
VLRAVQRRGREVESHERRYACPAAGARPGSAGAAPPVPTSPART